MHKKLLVGGIALGLAVPVVLRMAQANKVAEPAHAVLERDGSYELRDYAPRIVAETFIEGDLALASNQGFKRLAGYIFGGNRQKQKIAMTAPVSSEPQGQKIAMTAPVSSEKQAQGWRVTFTMPAGSTLGNLPVPLDDRVTLRQLPPTRMAALRFSGFATESSVTSHRQALAAWISQRGLHPVGEPLFARYDPPWVVPFLRRNELLWELTTP
jgi:hypothetical protein